MKITRREFAASAAAFSMISAFARAFAEGTADGAVGKKLAAWKQGHFQIHAIYSGMSESVFVIYPDGTSLLIDCGDTPGCNVPRLPSEKQLGSETNARYVLRVNPNGKKVDRFLLSHYHHDHGGGNLRHGGKSKYGNFLRSGLGVALEQLDFARVIDRAWPDFNDPFPVAPKDDFATLENLRGVYAELQRRGTRIEKFLLEKGSQQFDPLHAPIKDFSVTPLCANGRILLPDGSVRDLFAAMKPKDKPFNFGENPMSNGVLFQYGKFRFYTAGDFQGRAKQADGSIREIEDMLGEVLPKVNVAKANHHGVHSMPKGIVKALQAQVYFGCMWHFQQMTADAMARMADRTLYSGDRLLCPQVLPKLRLDEDRGKAWLTDVPKCIYEPKHLVFDVPPGGETFSLSFLRACDESMTVESVMNFQTRT